MLIFAEGGKPENPEKNHRSKGRINDKLNSHAVVRGEHLAATPPMLPMGTCTV
jgi:hypothetical protein